MKIMEKLHVEMGSGAFAGENGKRNLEECIETAGKLGFDFAVQLHNTASAEDIRSLRSAGVKLSAHAPLNSRWIWNFAAEEVGYLFDSVRENVELFRSCGIHDSVFHGFVMTDKPVEAFGHGKSYQECMREIYREELMLHPGSIFNGDFFSTDEFFMRQKRLKDRLAVIRREYPDISFRVENDFPAFGSGDLFADQLVPLDNPLCLDTGHMWISCRFFNRDFHEECAKMLASGRVSMLHLHASIYDDSYPLEKWSDGHRPLSTPNVMDLPRLVNNAIRAGMHYFVLEIPKGTADDLRVLSSWIH